MRTIVPPALRDLVAGWKANGSPSQPGIGWPRQQWIDSFPDHDGLLRGLPDALDRESVRRACTSAATDADAAERAFIAVMAWGYGSVGYGRFRVRRILTATPQASDRLATVARTLAHDGAVGAYGQLARHRDCRLRGLGPAFGTKYLYFTQSQREDVRALICDRLVADWLDRETNLAITAGEWSVATYSRYLDAMHDWASSLGCQPDELESCIFRAMSTERGSQWGRAPSPQAETTPMRRHGADSVVTHSPTGPLLRLEGVPGGSWRKTPTGEKGGTEMPSEFRAGKFRPDVYAQLVAAAKAGHTVAYSELPGGRGHIWGYLYRIAEYERAHGRPPLTALVVHKHDGLPGPGFAIAAAEVGYKRPGESDSAVWKRAVAEVFAHWKG